MSEKRFTCHCQRERSLKITFVAGHVNRVSDKLCKLRRGED